MTKQTAGELLRSMRLGPTATERHRERIKAFDKRKKPAAKGKKKAYHATKSADEPFGRQVAGICDHTTLSVPRDVLLERDRRMAMSPRSLTAAIFGDPLPGQREYLESLAAKSRRA